MSAWRWGLGLPALALPVVLALPLATGGGAAAAAPAAPSFDPAATTLTVGADGTGLVHFAEVGLTPGEVVDISVRLDVTVATSCVVPSTGAVMFSTSSSASALVQQSYAAGADGRLTGEQALTADAGSVSVEGLPCEVRRLQSTTATVTDEDNGVSLTLRA